MHDVLLPTTVLVSFAVLGLIFAILIARKTHWTSFRVLIVLNYAVSILISGIVHLNSSSAAQRSYFNVAELNSRELNLVLLTSIAGLMALTAGAAVRLPQQPLGPRTAAVLQPTDLTFLPALTALLLSISALALIRTRDYVATLEVFGGRVISVSGGMSRYAYISYWIVWAISFLVILIAGRITSTGHRSNRLKPTLLVLTGVVAIFAALEWTGGRSIGLLMALPLVLVMSPRIKVSKGVVLASAVALSFYVYQVTESRLDRSRLGNSGPLDWLDWEWGRFSMLGFSVRYTKESGFLWGETMLSPVSLLFEGVFRLAGLPYATAERRTTPQIATEYIQHSSVNSYIMPGFSPAELYLNFGLIGVIIGCFVLGWLCGWADTRFNSSTSPVIQLFWAYLGTLLVFRGINSDSSAVFLSIFWTGAPLVMAALLSHFLARVPGGTQIDRAVEASTAVTRGN